METVDPVRDAAHFQGLPEGLDEQDQRPDESRPGPAFGCRSEEDERGRFFASTSHISSPSEHETTLGCTPADRAVVECPSPGGLHHRRHFTFTTEKTLWELSHRQKALGPRAGAEQCLGDMPWKGRATAIKPDARYVAKALPKVKGPAGANRRGTA